MTEQTTIVGSSPSLTEDEQVAMIRELLKGEPVTVLIGEIVRPAPQGHSDTQVPVIELSKTAG